MGKEPSSYLRDTSNCAWAIISFLSTPSTVYGFRPEHVPAANWYWKPRGFSVVMMGGWTCDRQRRTSDLLERQRTGVELPGRVAAKGCTGRRFDGRRWVVTCRVACRVACRRRRGQGKVRSREEVRGGGKEHGEGINKRTSPAGCPGSDQTGAICAPPPLSHCGRISASQSVLCYVLTAGNTLLSAEWPDSGVSFARCFGSLSRRDRKLRLFESEHHFPRRKLTWRASPGGTERSPEVTPWIDTAAVNLLQESPFHICLPLFTRIFLRIQVYTDSSGHLTPWSLF